MPIEKPTVSVIIPTYNASGFILDTLKSVMDQTMRDLEVIVVDDHSCDNTLKIVRGFASLDDRIKYVALEKRSGVSRARNTGIKESKGKYIAFLDHDDLWLSQKLEKQLKLFQEDNELGLVFSRESIITLDGKVVGVSGGLAHLRRGYIFRDLLCEHFISPSTVLIKREVFDALDEWFVESMEMAEEADLFLRIAYVFKVDFCDEVLAKWRIHSSNDSSLRRGLLINDLNNIIKRLKSKIPDFEKKYKKEIARKQRWIAMTEVGILISENNKKDAVKKMLSFLRIFGFYPEELIKFFILLALGFNRYDKMRAVFLNLYRGVSNHRTNQHV